MSGAKESGASASGVRAHGGAGAHGGVGAHGSAGEAHTSTRLYVGVAAVLAVITAIEVMVFYVEALSPVLVPILLVLSASKFALVVMFFMHLKFDSPVFTWLFAGPLAVAVAVILAMLALYGVFTGGGG